MHKGWKINLLSRIQFWNAEHTITKELMHLSKVFTETWMQPIFWENCCVWICPFSCALKHGSCLLVTIKQTIIFDINYSFVIVLMNYYNNPKVFAIQHRRLRNCAIRSQYFVKQTNYNSIVIQTMSESMRTAIQYGLLKT